MSVVEEWRENSQKGLVCGMLDCRSSPEVKCDICGNHYCKEHIKIHFHIQDIKEDKK